MINVIDFFKKKHHIFGISKKRIILNYFKNIFFNTNIKNPRIKDNYDFKMSKKNKLFFRKEDLIVSTGNGLYQISNFKKKKYLIPNWAILEWENSKIIFIRLITEMVILKAVYINFRNLRHL